MRRSAIPLVHPWFALASFREGFTWLALRRDRRPLEEPASDRGGDNALWCPSPSFGVSGTQQPREGKSSGEGSDVATSMSLVARASIQSFTAIASPHVTNGDWEGLSLRIAGTGGMPAPGPVRLTSLGGLLAFIIDLLEATPNENRRVCTPVAFATLPTRMSRMSGVQDTRPVEAAAACERDRGSAPILALSKSFLFQEFVPRRAEGPTQAGSDSSWCPARRMVRASAGSRRLPSSRSASHPRSANPRTRPSTGRDFAGYRASCPSGRSTSTDSPSGPPTAS